MRVRVLSDRCQGHTLCSRVAPEVFLLREEDGHAYVELDQVPADLEETVRLAKTGCPELAIVVEE